MCGYKWIQTVHKPGTNPRRWCWQTRHTEFFEQFWESRIRLLVKIPPKICESSHSNHTISSPLSLFFLQHFRTQKSSEDPPHPRAHQVRRETFTLAMAIVLVAWWSHITLEKPGEGIRKGWGIGLDSRHQGTWCTVHLISMLNIVKYG